MNRLHLSQKFLTLAIVIASTTCVSQSTQGGSIKEIGVDGSFSLTTFDDQGFSAPEEITDIRFPTRVRMAWFSTEKLSIEISAAFSTTNQGNRTLTVFGASVGIGIHLAPVTHGGGRRTFSLL